MGMSRANTRLALTLVSTVVLTLGVVALGSATSAEQRDGGSERRDRPDRVTSTVAPPIGEADLVRDCIRAVARTSQVGEGARVGESPTAVVGQLDPSRTERPTVVLDVDAHRDLPDSCGQEGSTTLTVCAPQPAGSTLPDKEPSALDWEDGAVVVHGLRFPLETIVSCPAPEDGDEREAVQPSDDDRSEDDRREDDPPGGEPKEDEVPQDDLDEETDEDSGGSLKGPVGDEDLDAPTAPFRGERS